jgi:hypothetical protein
MAPAARWARAMPVYMGFTDGERGKMPVSTT